MAPNGFTSVSVPESDAERLDRIMQFEGLRSRTEVIRTLMRDWEITRLPVVNAPTGKSTPPLDDHTVEVYTTNGVLLARLSENQPFPSPQERGITIDHPMYT